MTATVKVQEKRVKTNEVDFDCLCVNQDNQQLVRGTVTVVAPTKRVTYDEVAPPELALRRGDSLLQLLRACEGLAPVRCAVAHPCDRDSLLGPLEAARAA